MKLPLSPALASWGHALHFMTLVILGIYSACEHFRHSLSQLRQGRKKALIFVVLDPCSCTEVHQERVFLSAAETDVLSCVQIFGVPWIVACQAPLEFSRQAYWSLKNLLQHHSLKASIPWLSAFFMVQLSHLYMTAGKTIHSFNYTDLCCLMSLLFNMLSRFVIAFLPRSKHLLISWLQSSSAVILDPKKIKSVTFTFPLLFAAK